MMITHGRYNYKIMMQTLMYWEVIIDLFLHNFQLVFDFYIIISFDYDTFLK
jgi:hypothetical protein